VRGVCDTGHFLRGAACSHRGENVRCRSKLTCRFSEGTLSRIEILHGVCNWKATQWQKRSVAMRTRGASVDRFACAAPAKRLHNARTSIKSPLCPDENMGSLGPHYHLTNPSKARVRGELYISDELLYRDWIGVSSIRCHLPKKCIGWHSITCT
jgi:hypothetical protein